MSDLATKIEQKKIKEDINDVESEIKKLDVKIKERVDLSIGHAKQSQITIDESQESDDVLTKLNDDKYELEKKLTNLESKLMSEGGKRRRRKGTKKRSTKKRSTKKRKGTKKRSTKKRSTKKRKGSKKH